MIPIIYIIILNYNGNQDTIECVRSLKKVEGPNFAIILIDNGSQHELRLEMARVFSNDPKVIFLQSDVNRGFAGGSNIGIKFALKHGADFILLLNNDTVVASNFLRELLTVFEPDVGIVGPKILYYDQPNRIWSDGGVINWIFFKGRTKKNKKDTAECTDVRDVDTVAGCALMIKREVVEKMGLMDECFFLYGEEDDWCYRAKKTGYRVVVNPRSVIWHKVSRSTGSRYNKTIAYYKTRNKILFIRKHLPVRLWPTAFIWLGMTLAYRCLQALLRGRITIISAIWKALIWHVYNQVEKEPHLHRVRRKI